MAVTQEVDLCIRHLQIEFVDAVHDEHILLGELQTAGLNESESHQLQTDDIVALHLQVAGQGHLSGTYLYAELHLRGDEAGMLGIVGHLLEEGLLLQRVCTEHGCRSVLDSLTL